MNKKSPLLLLINPWIFDFDAYDFWAKPLGFLYLAAVLRKNGFTINYLDCIYSEDYPEKNVIRLRKECGRGKFLKTIVEKPPLLKIIPRNYRRYGLPVDFIEDKLRKFSPPEVILITSTMTYWYPGVFEIIKMVKTIFPKIPTILGGIYPTLCFEHAKLNSGADIIVSGPGEIEILKLISNLTNKKISFYPDLNNLDSLPYPAFDLYPKLPYVCLITSRGCPYRCSYCASFLLYPKFTSRDPLAIVDEIEFWEKIYGVTNFAFYDDALLFEPQKRLIPLLQEIIHRKIKCNFHTPNGMHLRGITEEIAELMLKAGFKTIRFGLETADEELMKKTGGKITRNEFIKGISYLHRAGFAPEDIGIYLLAGLPGQKAHEVEDSIRFVKDYGAKPYLAEYSPIPGTTLWEEAVKNSRYDLTNEPLFHNNSVFPCEWEEFSRQDLERLKRLTRY